MPKSHVATTKLESGQHSIDRVRPTRRDDGGWIIFWAVRLHNGKLVKRQSRGDTQGQARRRAKDKAAELLATGGAAAKTSDRLDAYIRTNVILKLENNTRLAVRTKDQYRRALSLLLGDCRSQDHKHRDSLSGFTVADGTRFRTLESCLREIAELHGHEAMHQARSVLSGYVMPALKRDELIVADPVKGERLDFGQRPDRTRGGVALTAEQRQRIIDYLLELDPSKGVRARQQGRWSYADRVAKRQSAIDLTLLQAVTGARVSEANLMQCDRHLIDRDGELVVHLTKTIVKGRKKPRALPLFLDADDKVARRLRGRIENAPSPEAYLIGAPADRTKPWESGNCNKETAKLYQMMAQDLDIEVLEKERTHVWRTTLNTLLEGVIPETRRAALFGHDAEVNREHYLDLTDVSVLLEAVGKSKL